MNNVDSELLIPLYAGWVEQLKGADSKRDARLVDRLEWESVMQIGGTECVRISTLLKDCFSEMKAPNIPDHLGPGLFKSVVLNDEKVRVWGYSQYDPIDLPRTIFQSLSSFNGSPNTVVLQRLHERGIILTPEWLRKLYDFGILIAQHNP